MSILDDITPNGNGFGMPQATVYVRLRAERKPSNMNPDRTVEDWVNPEELMFTGFLASTSSIQTEDNNRRITTSTATLTVPDSTVDIAVNDRIRTEPDDGRLWRVAGFPSFDRNPFTGWQPTREIPLEEVTG